jgi:hypothetical protein
MSLWAEPVKFMGVEFLSLATSTEIMNWEVKARFFAVWTKRACVFPN